MNTTETVYRLPYEANSLLQVTTGWMRFPYAAYGFSVKDMSEADCVAELMKMYQELVNQQTK